MENLSREEGALTGGLGSPTPPVRLPLHRRNETKKANTVLYYLSFPPSCGINLLLSACLESSRPASGLSLPECDLREGIAPRFGNPTRV